LFCLFGLFALVWRKTLLTLAATAFFFAFWHTFLTSHNQGFQLSRTLQLSNHVHRCLLSAQTESTPFHWTAQMKQRLLADVREVDGFPVHFRVSAELNGSPMQYGDRFVVDGRFALPDEPLNPGEFDYHGFLNRQGVYLLLQAIPGNRTQLLSRGGANLFVGFALRLRHSIEPIPIASLEDDPTIQALIRGILFGDRSTIPPVILDELQDTGTLHLFVIDGLKVTLLAGFSWGVMRTARVARRWTFILIVPLLLYCAGTGLSIASLRATIMSAILLLGIALERPVLAKNILSGAGLFLLTLDTEQLFQLGFQLSFVTVAALTIATKPLAHLLSLPFRPDPWIPRRLLHPGQLAFCRIAQHSCELFSVCCVCWLATLPFAWSISHRVSWCNVAANFATVPIGASILALGVSSIVAAPFCRWASICLNNTNWLLGHLFLGAVHAFVALPYQSVNVAEPGTRSHPKLVILASGRSNSIYLHAGEVDGFINPGSDAKYRRVTQPFLRYQGVNQLRLLESTRRDPDHEGCLKQLERQFACVPAENPIANTFNLANRSFGWGTNPAVIDLDETGIRGGVPKPSPDRSGSGTSIMVRMGGYRILLIADSRRGSWSDTIDPAANPPIGRSIDLVCVSSPRSFRAAELQRAFDPQVIVYAQGKQNQFERSDPGQIIFLGEQGAAILELHGDTLKLQAFRGGQFTFRKRN
jgi:ComEC/Rec2-related protein